MAERPPAPEPHDAPEEPARIAVGKITKAHGVHGEVAVLVLSDVADRFAPGRAVLLEDGRALAVSASRSHHGRLLVTFEGVVGRDEAERLRGSYLFISEADLPELEGEAWWPHQLEGCTVVSQEGRALGELTEVLHTEANDVWVTRLPDGAELLIPALRDVIVEVDIAEKRITVREIEGLTAPQADEE